MTAQSKPTNDEVFLNALDANDRESRIDVKVDAFLYRAGKNAEDIFVENASMHGLQAKCDSPPAVGESVVLELAELVVFQGVVRWQGGDHFGVHTFERLDLNAFADPSGYQSLKSM